MGVTPLLCRNRNSSFPPYILHSFTPANQALPRREAYSLPLTAAISAPTATINAGTVQGGRCTGTPDAIYYKAIPYARPPVGNRRFAAPVAYNGHFPNGTLHATKPPPACIQFGDLFAETGPTSEDCLYLNIWTPANATKTSGLPVQVWIYGGSETNGGISNPLYDGFSVNYWLGPLGFLALSAAGFEGNQGIQDILLGLEWVRENIGAFGGDPKKVLLFGQSAGAVNAFIIATLPQAPSLINAAITESGGGRDVLFNSTAQRVGDSVAQRLSCKATDRTCLQSKSISSLQNAYKTNPFLSQGLGAADAIGIVSPESHVFYPHHDGKVIPAQPSHHRVQVPTVFGFAQREGTIFASAQFAPDLGSANSTAYNAFLTQNFGPKLAPVIKKYYPLSLFSSTTFPAIAAISTFQHTPSCAWLESIPPEAISTLGATHTAEIPLIFGNLAHQPVPDGSCNATTTEYGLASGLMGLWRSMAEKGEPSLVVYIAITASG
ncbi:Alpha/Beta hydrolase protein [Aspergillus alliaceus]|uniref:Alpha/Beta hydrolase protein n=1 Tax=Petromyces alliaceus TaxID=209559 RepID=UPI0012A4B27A|nr:Alpha/Beta hydrolase protein [Aspergillus alliaceus]KAB8229366.1 Alpha/Beta hydrolase protein [Aspergillus alliaceus]